MRAIRFVYPRIWPIAFMVMGIVAATSDHMHFNVAGLHLSGHDLMWFMMALAHAEVFWRGIHH